ncbi:carbonic anhydrase [Erythrobacter sanguineus]|jgi:carbonic anhydrase|uniref:Carbonic anhydrase n=1 Tax=Erythrobacter sanguineus TaxID=198312 RepID=A0A1M7RQY8_9SPHN|nr:carbonic anhydrase [Erythrobacter sanguineus]MCR9180732.1 carbonic anhydrase [Erythrobacteraceae bacterium]SHN48733.1 carbonic anhydrase [Erythrobacter sanguineus]
MSRFALGVIKFQREVFPEKKKLFERLSTGQSPEALFITCSDSRIETAMITQTDPGELFILRNAGNIVPPHTNQTGGMTASIEFAVGALQVPNIVICGHTECGAMKGAMHSEGLTNLPHVREWLGFAKGAVDIVETLGAGLSEEAKMRLLLEQNVMLQLQHLKTHPTVAVALAQKAVQLHGWVYDIKSGGVSAYDEASESWVPIEERYAAEVAASALADHACGHAAG